MAKRFCARRTECEPKLYRRTAKWRTDFEIEFVARDQNSRKELLSGVQIFGEKDGVRPEAVETYSELGEALSYHRYIKALT